jgi:biotin carboxyl carrier protein
LKLEIEFGGKARTVEIETDSARRGQIRCTIDGRTIEVDAAEVAPGIYSLLVGGTSLEARVEPRGTALRITVAGREYAAAVRDPRQWRRSRGAALEAEGRQQVIAPMPGKIVRLLVKAGEAVEAGQGILVVEAMKMQNEVRSPKSGTVERLLVSENQAVAAGDVLAVVA